MGSSLATILNQPVYKTNVKMRHLKYIMTYMVGTSGATTFDLFLIPAETTFTMRFNI